VKVKADRLVNHVIDQLSAVIDIAIAAAKLVTATDID
jgi:hypothetical protein